MAPHDGLVHPKEYDIKDSNVELIGSDLDHRVKYNSALTEPAWQNVGQAPGLTIWRIENFQVIPWPKEKYGQFYDGDSFIVLHTYKVGDDKLGHDIFFWLGSKTTQDEAGVAAYKTVELDEFLHGAATQYREVQQHPSDEFLALFRNYSIRSGGVRSGFTHVEPEMRAEVLTLLRVFKHPGIARVDSLIVHEVEPTWQSLDENDVFVLDKGNKIWVWQGKKCSPMEKAKAAQVVNDMTLAKHVDVEVLSQLESRSKIFVDLLGGRDVAPSTLEAPRPGRFAKRGADDSTRRRKLFRLSDASGDMSFDLVKEGGRVDRSELDGNDVFLYDSGNRLWVWQGSGASANEKAMWLKVAQFYVRKIQESQESPEAYLAPISKVTQGHESPAFLKALEV
ncbi:Gelsolin [Penicillium griseofulvum]|uniref:Gelsolin n=1 Tax=Penicillium patulum TaxID=5078 RepID=A0A135LRF0_PENPA|nr:Gelsolin [Penicillium griseofulvum]KXG51512.1 Gelsolin [Penicillium griseofulvum]